MKSLIVALVFLSGIPLVSIGQTTADWFAQKKVSLNNYGYCVSTGPEGNVYVSGSFTGSYRNPGPHEMGGFLSCFNHTGELQWHKEFYSPQEAIRIFNAVDSKGNVVIAGPGLLRFKSTGEPLNTFPSKGLRRCEGLCIDANDNIILAGFCFGDSVIGEIAIDGISFLAKYNNSRSQLWARPCHINLGPNQDFDLVVDNNGSILVSGGFTGTIEVTASQHLSTGGEYKLDGFVIKYDPHGNPVWATSFGGEKSESPRSVSVSENGDVYIAGTYYGMVVAESFSTPAQQGVCDLFVIKYDREGKFQWLKSGGGEDLDKVREIIVDSYENIFMTGYYDSPQSFSWDKIPVTSLQNDKGGLYLFQLDSDGNAISFVSAGGGGGDGRDISCDNKGNLYLTGGFDGLLNFAGQTIEGNGMFLMKLSYDMNNKVGLRQEATTENLLFQIFPNPGHGVFTITFTEDLCPNATINVYDVCGHCIQQNRNVGCDENNLHCFAPPGIYLVELRNGSKRQTKKIIIQ